MLISEVSYLHVFALIIAWLSVTGLIAILVGDATSPVTKRHWSSGIVKLFIGILLFSMVFERVPDPVAVFMLLIAISGMVTGFMDIVVQYVVAVIDRK